MPVRERLRQLFGADRLRPEEGDRDPTSDDAAREDAPVPVGAGPSDDAVSASPADLPIAQGQELLGPCDACGGCWTREITRGRKPETCPVCKREGPPR